ncbi:hypothetical protein [Falsiroseomonas tokyonensis]|uniref:Uncharacterized protein n=1 Tax=Falsiroseomonas tokyonensis TaxID=430521 RepID=A0ABV7BM05_9PROT|nr:hypothetical protein [Falsiroseomonas tokyonensis]MBU8536579.1 hypothetical protein [Falsiroseomonas tokyonensis]
MAGTERINPDFLGRFAANQVDGETHSPAWLVEARRRILGLRAFLSVTAQEDASCDPSLLERRREALIPALRVEGLEGALRSAPTAPAMVPWRGRAPGRPPKPGGMSRRVSISGFARAFRAGLRCRRCGHRSSPVLP